MRKISYQDITNISKQNKELQKALLNGNSIGKFLIFTDDLLKLSNNESWQRVKKLIGIYSLDVTIKEIKVKGIVSFKVIIRDNAKVLFNSVLKFQIPVLIEFISNSVFSYEKSKLTEKLNLNLAVGKSIRQQKI